MCFVHHRRCRSDLLANFVFGFLFGFLLSVINVFLLIVLLSNITYEHIRTLKIGDARSIRRVQAAEIFKAYDGESDGCVKISNFGFIFKDLVENKHISSKLMLRDVVAQLDEAREGLIYLNDFIAWIESVSCI